MTAMNHPAIQQAQDIAQAQGLSPDEGLFLQGVPAPLLAALARGEANLMTMVREELQARGLDLNGQWVGFEQAATADPDQMSVDQFVAEEHERLEGFRQAWHSANKINPVQFPMSLPKSNWGLWGEMANDYELGTSYEVQPEPPAPRSPRPRKG